MRIAVAAAWPTVKRGRFALSCWVGTIDTRTSSFRSIRATGRPGVAYATAKEAFRTDIWI